MMRFIFFVSLFALLNCGASDVIRPFVSDGCSAFPDGSIKQKDLWLSCCVTHDRAYWMGGTYAQRLNADRGLKKCVETLGKPKLAKLMLAGVRVGGTPYLPTSFRWAYGWSYPRGYKKLTLSELNQIKKVQKETN